MYFGAHVKSSGGVWTRRERRGHRRRGAAVLRRQPADLAADRLQGQGRGAVPRGPRRVPHPLRAHPHHLPDQPGHEQRGLLREVGDGRWCGALARPTSSAPTPSSPTSARIRAPASRPGLERVQAGLRRALAESLRARQVRLLLENTAGAGGTMGVDFLSSARSSTPPAVTRASACASTRRTSSSRLDLRTPAGMAEALNALDAGCGRERLVALHLNDSKTPLGSNRDRHENVGEGDLGTGRLPHHRQRAGLRRPARHPRGARVRRPGPGRGEPGPPADAGPPRRLTPQPGGAVRLWVYSSCAVRRGEPGTRLPAR